MRCRRPAAVSSATPAGAAQCAAALPPPCKATPALSNGASIARTPSVGALGAAAFEKWAMNSFQGGPAHNPLDIRCNCWHVGDDGANASSLGVRGAHFLCLRKLDCSPAVTFSDMRFALASTSAGVAPAHASHALMHVLMGCSWIAHAASAVQEVNTQ